MSLILEPPKSMAQEIAHKHIQCMHYIRTGCSCVGWANPDIPSKMSDPKIQKPDIRDHQVTPVTGTTASKLDAAAG